MSTFKQQYGLSLRGASFESAEDAPLPIVIEEAITPAYIAEVRDERMDLNDNMAEVKEQTDDVEYLQSSAIVTDPIAEVVAAAPNVPPVDGEAFVAMANQNITTAAVVLDTEIPLLVVDDTGAVSELSQESLGEWFTGAAKSFKEASGRFFTRLALGFSRLNESSKGLLNRSIKLKGKLGSRKGEGGKEIKLDTTTKALLIVGDNYSQDLLGDVTLFCNKSLELSDIVMSYSARLTDLLKKRIFEALSRNTVGSPLLDLEVADLLRLLDAALGSQPKNYLGNCIYMANQGRGSKVLTYGLKAGDPNAVVLVKHLDTPKSLSNDQISALLEGLVPVMTNQAKKLEVITDQATSSFNAVRAVLEKLNTRSSDNVDDMMVDNELEDSIDTAELLRLENHLVAELGKICSRLTDYQADAIKRINALLTYAEESVFQD